MLVRLLVYVVVLAFAGCWERPLGVEEPLRVATVRIERGSLFSGAPYRRNVEAFARANGFKVRTLNELPMIVSATLRLDGESCGGLELVLSDVLHPDDVSVTLFAKRPAGCDTTELWNTFISMSRASEGVLSVEDGILDPRDPGSLSADDLR